MYLDRRKPDPFRKAANKAMQALGQIKRTFKYIIIFHNIIESLYEKEVIPNTSVVYSSKDYSKQQK